MEVQGYSEEEFARRMYVYNYRAFDKYGKDVVSLAVLTDRNPSYRPSKYEFKLNGFRLLMEFPVVKLLDYQRKEEELEKSEDPFGLVTLAWLRSKEGEEERYRSKKELLREVIRLWRERGWSRERLKRLLAFISLIIRLPEELEKKLRVELQEEVSEMASYIIPLFKDEYEKEYKRGLQQGIQQGLQQGLKEGKQEKLMVLIELKYGEKGVELIPLVSKLEDIALIDYLADLAKMTDDYEKFKEVFLKALRSLESSGG